MWMVASLPSVVVARDVKKLPPVVAHILEKKNWCPPAGLLHFFFEKSRLAGDAGNDIIYRFIIYPGTVFLAGTVSYLNDGAPYNPKPSRVYFCVSMFFFFHFFCTSRPIRDFTRRATLFFFLHDQFLGGGIREPP